jgi:hypothetical protein
VGVIKLGLELNEQLKTLPYENASPKLSRQIRTGTEVKWLALPSKYFQAKKFLSLL